MSALPGLNVRCRNAIPHSRGLGSSAAAVVGGLAAVNGLVAQADSTPLTETQLIQLSSEFEGHPDNAAAAVLGGAVVSWTRPRRRRPALRGGAAAAAPRHPAVPGDSRGSARRRRRPGCCCPTQVSHDDARFNVSRAALLVRGAHRAARSADGGHRGRAASTAARAGDAGFGGISAAAAALWRGSGAFRRWTCGDRTEHEPELPPEALSSAPRTDSRHRDDRRRRCSLELRESQSPVESTATRRTGVSCFRHEAGYSRSRPAIAASDLHLRRH